MNSTIFDPIIKNSFYYHHNYSNEEYKNFIVKNILKVKRSLSPKEKLSIVNISFENLFENDDLDFSYKYIDYTSLFIKKDNKICIDEILLPKADIYIFPNIFTHIKNKDIFNIINILIDNWLCDKIICVNKIECGPGVLENKRITEINNEDYLDIENIPSFRPISYCNYPLKEFSPRHIDNLLLQKEHFLDLHEACVISIDGYLINKSLTVGLQTPTILIAILAKNKELTLPLYLKCIENLDYPKHRITILIRTNDNNDKTEFILEEWMKKNKIFYSNIIYDNRSVDESIKDVGQHDWSEKRFSILAKIRQDSLNLTVDLDLDYYFTADCDNFIRSNTLKELLKANVDVISPFLVSKDEGRERYSNYHFKVAGGYFIESSEYHSVYNREIKGILDIECVHTTYLIKSSVIHKKFISYFDEEMISESRYEYALFSLSCRRNNITQYFDNRSIYGYITFVDSYNEGSKNQIKKYKKKYMEKYKNLLLSIDNGFNN